MTEISEAEKEYTTKVCKEYLGIPRKYCRDEFQKLLSNMRAGIKATAGESFPLEAEKLSEGIDTMEKKGFSLIRKIEERKRPAALMEKDGNLVVLKEYPFNVSLVSFEEYP